MSTTPAKVLEMLLDLPKLNRVVDVATPATAYRLPRTNQRALLDLPQLGTVVKAAASVAYHLLRPNQKPLWARMCTRFGVPRVVRNTVVLHSSD